MKLLYEEKGQTYSILAEKYDSVREAEEVVKQHDNELFNKCFSALYHLITIKETHSELGWDGNNALPVSGISFSNAFRFLLMLPEQFKCPVPGVCANGQITLEWRQPDGRLLSLAFDDKGMVNYIVFLLDGERIWGVNKAFLGYNEVLSNFLQKVS